VEEFAVNSTPDTGCTRTIISGKIAKANNLRILSDDTVLIAANGEKMNVIGKTDLTARTNDREATISALVSDVVAEDMLLSWQDLIRLGVISKNFPNTEAKARGVASDSLVKKLIADYPDVISDTLPSEPITTGDPMTINLLPNAVPKKVTAARRIPKRYEKEANDCLKGFIKDGIIQRVEETTDWCCPAFFVPKPDGIRVRLVTDFTELNKYVKRPVHLFPSAMEIIQAIPPEAKYFAKFDAVNGYFQLALDEKSRKLTTFLLPQGKFCYCRAPMGLNASSDEWCAHSDKIIEGLSWARKIVDDTLIWATSNEELGERAIIFLDRCRKFGVTISKKKLEAGQEIEFAGHIISKEGIRADDKKYAAIKDFPRPKNVKDLRGFMGLAQQLAPFNPDLAHMTATMRPLLKKGSAWLWLEEHEKEFIKAKELLTSKHVIKPFDPTLKTVLLTDASRLHGLGFALIQKSEDGTSSLVMCGSKSLTPTQERYATVELECLAIQWAVLKCDYYLRGDPGFQVLTDHKPLLGVFRKDLHTLENARLMRMREKIQHYCFTVDWVAGETHKIADALSRYPVFTAQEEELPIDTSIKCLQAREEDPSLAIITESIDEEYRQLMRALKKGETPNGQQAGSLHQFRDKVNHLSIEQHGEEELIMLDSSRLVIPRPARRRILQELHRAHSGITKMTKTAEQLYYWPFMRNDIANAVSNCQACQESRPKQQRGEIAGFPPSHALHPMKHVASDLFDCKGQTWLVLTDRYSGYGWTAQLRKTHTKAVTDQLTKWFNDFGWPDYIRTDGGPQYRQEFKDFCKERSITHELASAHNPESNGLAESAVKSIKQIVQRCKANKEEVDSAIAAWRNMCRADGLSPSQLFFNRRQKHFLPMTNQQKALEEQCTRKKDDLYMKSIDRRNNHTAPSDILTPGTRARMQHHQTGEWKEIVTISKVRDDKLSYIITTESGRELVRGRRFLRPLGGLKSSSKGTKGTSFSQNTKMNQAKAFRVQFTNNNKPKNTDQLEYTITNLDLENLTITLKKVGQDVLPIQPPNSPRSLEGPSTKQVKPRGDNEFTRDDKPVLRVSYIRAPWRDLGDRNPGGAGAASGADPLPDSGLLQQKTKGSSGNHQKAKRRRKHPYATLQRDFASKRGRGQGRVQRGRPANDRQRSGALQQNHRVQQRPSGTRFNRCGRLRLPLANSDIPKWSTELTTSATTYNRENDWGAETWSDVEANTETDIPSAQQQQETLANIKVEPVSDTESEDWDKAGALAVLAEVEEEAKADRAAQAAIDRARARFKAQRTLGSIEDWSQCGSDQGEDEFFSLDQLSLSERPVEPKMSFILARDKKDNDSDSDYFIVPEGEASS
jgi:hypothetical protein